jgi:hypothetical protein
VALSIFFADFSLTASPTLNTVTAGQSTSYKITVIPYNSFNYVVLLSCGTVVPQNTTCAWSPPGVTLNGTTPATATVTVTTTTQNALLGPPPRPGPMLWFLAKLRLRIGVLWAVALLLITAAILDRRRRRGIATHWLSLSLRISAIGAVLFVMTTGMSCNNSTYGPNITPANLGTPTGNYIINITGTLGNNNSVTRIASVNLSVGPG